jgi:hypothetical protein
MAIAYGDKAAAKWSDKGSYYQNRFARVYPTYIVCNLLALPIWFYGFGFVRSSDVWGIGVGTSGSIVYNLAVSIVPVSSFLLTAPLDGPAWTGTAGRSYTHTSVSVLNIMCEPLSYRRLYSFYV